MKYSYSDYANVYTHMHMPNTTSKGVAQKIHDVNFNIAIQNCLWIHTCNCNSIVINIFLKQIQSINKPNLKSTYLNNRVETMTIYERNCP